MPMVSDIMTSITCMHICIHMHRMQRSAACMHIMIKHPSHAFTADIQHPSHACTDISHARTSNMHAQLISIACMHNRHPLHADIHRMHAQQTSTSIACMHNRHPSLWVDRPECVNHDLRSRMQLTWHVAVMNPIHKCEGKDRPCPSHSGSDRPRLRQLVR
jgi:hypothetical protein